MIRLLEVPSSQSRVPSIASCNTFHSFRGDLGTLRQVATDRKISRTSFIVSVISPDRLPMRLTKDNESEGRSSLKRE
jgi:hypothetical protein